MDSTHDTDRTSSAPSSQSADESDHQDTEASAGGYSIEDARTRRALLPDLVVSFLTFGPGYVVEHADGTRYVVDIEAETCGCDEHRETGVYCAHLRRADLAIRTGEIPDPDGYYLR